MYIENDNIFDMVYKQAGTVINSNSTYLVASFPNGDSIHLPKTIMFGKDGNSLEKNTFKITVDY